MQTLLVLLALLISTVSGYHLGCATSRPLLTSSSARYSNMNRLPNMILQSSPAANDVVVVTETSNIEQAVVEVVAEIKKEEWRDPVAVAAAGKGPFDDLFPGGVSGGNILSFAIYGYIGYLLLDSVRIMVMNYGVVPPPV